MFIAHGRGCSRARIPMCACIHGHALVTQTIAQLNLSMYTERLSAVVGTCIQHTIPTIWPSRCYVWLAIGLTHHQYKFSFRWLCHENRFILSTKNLLTSFFICTVFHSVHTTPTRRRSEFFFCLSFFPNKKKYMWTNDTLCPATEKLIRKKKSSEILLREKEIADSKLAQHFRRFRFSCDTIHQTVCSDSILRW